MKQISIVIVCALIAFAAFKYFSSTDTVSLHIDNQQSTQSEPKNGSEVKSLQTSTTSNSAQSSPSKNNLLQHNQSKQMNVTFHTNKGNITLELFTDRVPNTTANFKKLAESGFYNGVKFHRVIQGFMIQGGDPLTKDDSLSDRWGTGGPGYTFADEITPENKNDVGTISMANAGPNTNGSQFFINVKNNNFLDTKHTVFGKVISGMDVVTQIENTETDANDRPVVPVVIERISF